MTRRQQTPTEPMFATVRDLPQAVDGYRLLAHIASGGTSSVYLAESRCGDRVALKVLEDRYLDDDAVVRAFLAEAEVTNATTHDNLLSIYRTGRAPKTNAPYLVMELLDGETLQSLVDRIDLPVDTVVAIAREIAEGVAALHAADIAHCDIKPANVLMLLDGDYALKVIDYGIAHRGTDAPRETIAGTPSCMAPEQWRGSPCPKSDVYALGCMMFELITREPLFSGTIAQLAVAHCEQMPTRPSAYVAGIDPALEKLIVRTLAKDPAMRPTMADLADELARFAPAPAIELGALA